MYSRSTGGICGRIAAYPDLGRPVSLLAQTGLGYVGLHTDLTIQ